MPDVIPPALEIDFQEAIRAFKPSAFPMVPIAQPWEGKEAYRLVRFGIQIRLVFVAQGPVILLGNYANFSHLGACLTVDLVAHQALDNGRVQPRVASQATHVGPMSLRSHR